MTDQRAARWLVPAYSMGLALLIVGPLLGPGYLLLRDAVSTPRSYLTDTSLGLGESAPRAVPQDALLAVLSVPLDGGLIVKAIMVAALWAAGYGAARLAQVLINAPLSAQLVASTAALWNPYVAERLLQGHWSLLTGYAALPWITLIAHRLRTAPSWQQWARFAGCLAAAGLTPTGALLAGLVGMLVAGWRRLPATLPLFLGVCAPWLIASVVSGAGTRGSDPAGVTAFAARAEPGLGTLGSVAGLGGIWNSEAVPGSRTTLWALVGTLIFLLLVAAGFTIIAAAGPARQLFTRRVLLGLAGAGIIFPALAATGWGTFLLEELITAVPGAGLLRDTQKWAALAMPAYTVCAAAGCLRITRLAPKVRPGAAAAGGILLLFAALPDLAWGVGGELRPIRYPSAWDTAVTQIDAPGAIAVLPAGMFRIFPYSGPTPVLDPAPRLLPRQVLQTGDLPVRGHTVAGESARARTVEELLLHGASPAELAQLGVGFVLVEHDTPGQLGAAQRTLAQLTVRMQTPELSLYQVPGVQPVAPAPHRGLVLAAHTLWFGLLVAPLLTLPLRTKHSPHRMFRRRSQRPDL